MAVSSSSAGPCAPRVWARGASPRATDQTMPLTPSLSHKRNVPPGGARPGKTGRGTQARGGFTHTLALSRQGRGEIIKQHLRQFLGDLFVEDVLHGQGTNHYTTEGGGGNRQCGVASAECGVNGDPPSPLRQTQGYGG